MKYFIIALIMILLVILYVWQNIKVVTLEMDFNRSLQIEKRLIVINDRLKYEIEKLRRMDLVEAFAKERKAQPLTPKDFDILYVPGKSPRARDEAR